MMSRIVLHLLAAALVALGLLSPDMAGLIEVDPEALALTEWGIAAATSLSTEVWAFFKRKAAA